MEDLRLSRTSLIEIFEVGVSPQRITPSTFSRTHFDVLLRDALRARSKIKICHHLILSIMTPRLISSASSLRLQQCTYRTRPSCFSTSAPVLAQVPPESPKFIEIPRPVQPSQPFPTQIKGVLPVPRPVFRRRPKPQDRDKASPEYLADVTPEPIENQVSKKYDPRIADAQRSKARQSEARRRNLRESLVELDQRKAKTDQFLEARSRRKQIDRQIRLTEPEREDERLTSPSVMQSETPKMHHILSDPNREARLARKRENVIRTEAMRQEERRDKLHTLYVNAGSFITTDKQLNSMIDKVFDDQDQFRSDQKPGLNMWNLGLPETVSQLLSQANKDPRSQKAMASAEGNSNITRERMNRIAEELTGGKMQKMEKVEDIR